MEMKVSANIHVRTMFGEGMLMSKLRPWVTETILWGKLWQTTQNTSENLRVTPPKGQGAWGVYTPTPKSH